ncbi:MAG: DUF4339 domain-containing protein [Verrucomicrobiaceae bacterium]|nr:DUF4339 domain-containing protein [Verrucomicrobiaceae bacterium]
MDEQQASNERWYYSLGEAVNGPFSLSELLQKAEQGVLNSETLVVPEGSEDWRPFSAITPANTTPQEEKEEPSQQAEPSPIPLESAGTMPNDNVDKPGPKKLRDKFLEAPVAPSEKPAPNNKDALKGCGVLVLLIVVAAILWHHWRFLLTTGGFLGVWYGFASSSLQAKRSKVYSVGGGFVLGLLTMMLMRSCVGTDGNAPSADSVEANAKRSEIVSPIFQHEAASTLKHLTDQFRKLESLTSFLNSDRPLPSSIDGYARLTTTQDIRAESQDFLNALSARLAELERVGKAANGYAKASFEVRKGFTYLLLAVKELETFVNEPSGRVQAARSLQNHRSMVKNAISSANDLYHEASKMAGFELIEASEYRTWFDQGVSFADRFSTFWKELDQSQSSNGDTEKRLATLRAEGKNLCANYDKWIFGVRDKEASISDANQMARLIQHDDLEEELSAIFTALESTIELDLSDDRQDRIQVLRFMEQRIEDARRKFH